MILSLNISHCPQLAEFSVLKALGRLEYLDLSCNLQFDDLDSVSTCVDLLQCDLSWTAVTSTNVLAACTRLEVVYVRGIKLRPEEGDLSQANSQVDCKLLPNLLDSEKGDAYRVMK
jgi:hypothetical protein